MRKRILFWPLFIVISSIVGYLLWIIPDLSVPAVKVKEVLEITMTIPEGKTMSQITRVLVAKHLASTSDEVNNSAKDILEAHEFEWLRESVGLEGYLFPDTYRVYFKPQPKKVLKIMLTNFERKVIPVVEEGKDLSPMKDLHSIITLASIVERESPAGERGRIADIFIRRLHAGIPLQADSTVNYVTGGNKPSLTYNETKIDSLYNTYKYRGLPPGPIANPGLAAIRAVLHPTSNEYWYFLSTKDGKIIYSKTLEEHNKAKAMYLRD